MIMQYIQCIYVPLHTFTTLAGRLLRSWRAIQRRWTLWFCGAQWWISGPFQRQSAWGRVGGHLIVLETGNTTWSLKHIETLKTIDHHTFCQSQILSIDVFKNQCDASHPSDLCWPVVIWNLPSPWQMLRQCSHQWSRQCSRQCRRAQR